MFRDTAYYLATGGLPTPLTRAQKAAVVVDHFETLHRLRGEASALRMIRQRISWYSSQLQPWPGLRRGVGAVGSAAQFYDYMAAGIEQIKAANPGVAVAAT